MGPPTPEFIDLKLIGLSGTPTNPAIPAGVRANPVPSVLEAAGMYNPNQPYTVMRSLMHGETRPTWDGGIATGSGATQLFWMMFADDFLIGKVFDPQTGGLINASAPQYPGPTYRAPRGAVCHNFTASGGPPPHTIHWHGIEPTPMNDGVGHCSFEVTGSYIYQWQPNFIGTYFYHCHRNTMMHFEYGLAGFMLFDPPDAYFASIGAIVDPDKGTVTLSGIPIGNGRPEPAGEGGLPAAPQGRRRTAANLNFSGLPQFPGFVGGDPIQGVATPDPWTGDPFLKFKYDPHAFTVPYDVEALWFVDDRSSQWSQATNDAFATFPVGANIGGTNVYVGFNEGFHNGGKSLSPEAGNAFFAFNDFNADYWFISGVPVPAAKGGTAQIPAGILYPAELNSGIIGSQVSIQANLGDTVFIRCLCGSYNSARVTFPVDVVIIEWDGRALGVPPLNRYTRPHLVPAGTPIVHSTARRWGAILRSTTPVVDFAKVEFLETRSTSPLSLTGGGDVLMTAMIPITIT